MFDSCMSKQDQVKSMFQACVNLEDRYQMIIDMGKKQSSLDPHEKTELTRVQGCQSNMFVKSFLRDGLCIFETESDALISAGLGVLLTMVYSGEPPEAVLKCPPLYLDELNIRASLTPGRANGLASLYIRMKQEALKMYVEQSKKV